MKMGGEVKKLLREGKKFHTSRYLFVAVAIYQKDKLLFTLNISVDSLKIDV